MMALTSERDLFRIPMQSACLREVKINYKSQAKKSGAALTMSKFDAD
jgi:hypothetical protein